MDVIAGSLIAFDRWYGIAAARDPIVYTLDEGTLSRYERRVLVLRRCRRHTQ